MSLNLNLNPEIDSGYLLEGIRKELQRSRFAPNWTIQSGLIKLLKSLPVPIMKRLPLPDITFMISNFPGPPKPANLWNNNEILDLMFWINAPELFTVVTFSILSYNGFVKIGVVANSTFARDQGEVDNITRNIQLKLEEVLQKINTSK